jgi:hypothetical protein
VIRGGPAGGGYSTVNDLLKFDIALRSNKLLSEKSTQIIMTPKIELNSPDYGFGFSIDNKNKLVGHYGGFIGISSVLEMSMENGYSFFILSNYGNTIKHIRVKAMEIFF